VAQGGSSAGGGSNGGSGGKKFRCGHRPESQRVTPGNNLSALCRDPMRTANRPAVRPSLRTKDVCITAQKMACSTTLSLDAAAMDAKTGFDATKAKAAMTQFETLASKCDTSISLFAISTDGFRGIVAGTVASGGACDADSTATNKTAATAVALASCLDPATNACLPVKAPGSWTCAARSDAAGKCFTDANCKDGLFCDPGLSLDRGACTARKAAGADCMANNECTSFACASNKCVTATSDTAYCLEQVALVSIGFGSTRGGGAEPNRPVAWRRSRAYPLLRRPAAIPLMLR